MSFVQREIERISEDLRSAQTPEMRDRLYAAQQALYWSLDPETYRKPYEAIRGIPAGSEDCSAHLRRPQS